MPLFIEFLLNEKIFSKEELLLHTQVAIESGQSLVSSILSSSNINPHTLYKKIAKYEKLAFADLRKYPCDRALLSPDFRDEYLKLQAIPWKKKEDVTVIAVSEITHKVKEWAEKLYQGKYIFAITTPFDITHSINSIFAQENDFEAREKLWQEYPECSAKEPVCRKDIIIFLAVIVFIFLLACLYPVEVLAIAFFVTAFFYNITILFKTILVVIGHIAAKQAEKESRLADIKDKDLPAYTILVPLYKEEGTLSKLVSSIQALNYPKSKLDVKLIVEEDDEVTINAIKDLRPSRIFEMVVVPYSLPRTKPKACNYALRFARGEYVTIYDAEDIPEPDQLKKVLYKFESSPEDLECVQARLNYFNRSENLLTRMFAIEYSTLFDFMLFGLEKINIPIPLGGTSNHFRTRTLRKLYGWDPYNVTEDADLGLRISQNGWKCGMIWSCTMEEAPISLWAWIKQRTRWIKGHMQTYIVHMRSPLSLYRKIGFVSFMGMQFFLGASTVIFIISPIMWLIWVLFMLGIIQLDVAIPAWFNAMLDLSVAGLFLGILLQVIFAVCVIVKNKWKNMLPYSVFFPFYWILHSIASFRALWQLVKCPHYWEKTTHGVSKWGVCGKMPQDKTGIIR